VEGNGPNQAVALAKNAVTTLAELINDEDDNALADKAFESLEALGSKVVPEIVTAIEKVVANSDLKRWGQGNTIILDMVEGGKERHLYN
jgi:ABC-type uncharacterized transport system auxiliary subunit